MSISELELRFPMAVAITMTDDMLSVALSDGRTIVVPLNWYPRLQHASPEERKAYRLVGGGEGLHWPAIEEDISVEGLLAGRPSSETQLSLQRWIAGRRLA